MKKRKLISRPDLEELYDLQQIGVPLSRIKRDRDVDLSLPTLIALIDSLEQLHLTKVVNQVSTVIEASLFPKWLKETSTLVQTQPDDWHYIGKFPVGSWVQRG